MTDKIKLGNKGEEIAINFLKEKGFKILDKNWRYKKSEIDIIISQKNILIFVEVKTRKSNYFSRPEEAITPKKIDLYQEAAEAYLEQHKLENEVRFDVISIIHTENKTKIEHFINAF